MFDNNMAFGTLRDFMGDSDLLDALVNDHARSGMFFDIGLFRHIDLKCYLW